MRKILIIILPLLVLWACNNPKDVSIVDRFKTIQPIAHKVFNTQNGADELLNPNNLVIVGNTMTTNNLQSPKIFTSIDIVTGRVIKHWGDRGQGPDEFQGMVSIYNNYSETGLNIWDNLTLKLYYSSNSDLESDSVYFYEIPTGINKREGGIDLRDAAIQIDTFMFFVTGGNNNKRFSLVDLKNNEVKEIGDFPAENINNTSSNRDAIWRNMAYQGRIIYNRSLKKIVYVSRNSEMFEIYNTNGSDAELAMGSYTTTPKYREVAQNTGGRTGWMGVNEYLTNGKGRNLWATTSDENIFILYQNYSQKKGIDTKLNFPLEKADMVLVFDWDGKPVKIYELDCFPHSITYDKARNRLWAIHNNEDSLDPEIIYFEL